MNTNLLRTITPEEVDTYHRDGVLLLQNMFDKDWIELLNKGLDANCESPTERARIWDKDASGDVLCFMTTRLGEALTSTESSFLIPLLPRFVAS